MDMRIPLDEITALRHELHRHPELSGQETQTMQTLIHFLRCHTTLEIIVLDGWFCACYHSTAGHKRPPIAFRADMDALPMPEHTDLPYASENPGVSHKCGHDGHSAALAGFGCILSELAPDRDVWLIFQAAEEIGTGGAPCSRFLAEQGIAEVYACHNWSGFPQGEIRVKGGPSQCASRGLTIRFCGAPSHASQPEDGRNPSAAIAELALYVTARGGYERQRTDKPLVFATIVGMRTGGRNFGMSASEGELCVTLRAERERDLTALRADLLAQAEKLAAEGGFAVSFADTDVFPETVCDPAAAQKVHHAAQQLGLRHTELSQPYRASEDFGCYLQVCRGAIFYIGNGTDYPGIHTADYDFADANLPRIIQMFAALCTMDETL